MYRISSTIELGERKRRPVPQNLGDEQKLHEAGQPREVMINSSCRWMSTPSASSKQAAARGKVSRSATGGRGGVVTRAPPLLKAIPLTPLRSRLPWYIWLLTSSQKVSSPSPSTTASTALFRER